jgi:chromosome segregation ATPase
MKRLMAVGLCGVLVCSGGIAVVLAQNAAISGGVAALEQQKGEIDKEIKAVEQKLAVRRKAIEEQANVAAARKVKDTAEKAFNDFTASDAVYTKLDQERKAKSAASVTALENAKTADAEYLALRKQLIEVNTKRGEAEKKLREAAPDAQEALKQELAGFAKEAREIEKKKTECQALLKAKPEVAEAIKAAAAADTPYQEFVKNNAEYLKLAKESKEAGTAYRKVFDEGKAADAEYTLLSKQLEDVRVRRNEIEKTIAEAKKAEKTK